MFGEKLSEAIKAAGVNPSELSRRIGCDRSNLSRMCSGARVPKKSAAASRRVVDAICAAAAETDGAAALGALIGYDGETVAQLKQRLMDWLYEDVAPAPAKPRKTKKSAPYATFGGRLNAVMELAELSNVRFGKLLNLDASYISRFRNGLRSPAANPQMMDDMTGVLLKLLTEQEKIGEFASMADAPRVPVDEEDAFLMIRHWLFDVGRDTSFPTIEEFLSSIDSFVPNSAVAPQTEPAERDDRRIYYRTEGLRAAVMRFLTEAESRGAKRIFLYSDQNLEWMVGDNEYRIRLFSQLIKCLKSGVQITVIHNIDRSQDEMFSAIANWMPLYMTGSISSYYFRKQSQSRFSYTLFLCPDFACVEGGGVAGSEDVQGIYRYDTDAEILEAHRRGFESMLEKAKPLVSVYESDDAERLALMGSGMTTIIGPGGPVAAMPMNTLFSILDRAGVTEETRRKAIQSWRMRRGVLEKTMREGFLHLCSEVSDKALVKAGKVPIVMPGLSMNYTPQEHDEHLRSLLDLMERFPNFRYFALPRNPFLNMRVIVSETAVAIVRMKPPYASFLISHPMVREAFAAYVNKIKESCGYGPEDAVRKLEEHL
ncbi:MAG: helix-turn-helix transcriptional regulator [Clostridia bacterium]|nr:helix-turn-helix transcriptional regulator [Clostridia bacterium]